MKWIFSFLIFCFIGSLHAQAPGNFSIDGNAGSGKLTVAKVYLQYQMAGEMKIDSADAKNGSYQFSGSLSEPVMARIRAKYLPDAEGKVIKPTQSRDVITLFLSASPITVQSVDSFSNATISGSPAHADYQILTQLLKPISQQMDNLFKQYEAAGEDAEKKKLIEASADSIDLLQKNVYADFVRKQPASPIAVYCVNVFAGWDINPDQVAPIFELLPAVSKETYSGKNLGDRIAIARKTAIGNIAPEFTQNDTLGKPVALSSFRGKYVLVDFWASWCGPCRRENPQVVKAFQQFKGKGFTILGVSLDQPGAKDRWMDAIHKDGLTWTHVSDLKYWENEVAKQYGIRAIPQNLLLDPGGKIVAKNLNGETLTKKLEELLNK
ncbi:MAG: TlpA disulfide reductase family protein [Chitinophagia bacterium]|jgi:peroxiredoxin